MTCIPVVVMIVTMMMLVLIVPVNVRATVLVDVKMLRRSVQYIFMRVSSPLPLLMAVLQNR